MIATTKNIYYNVLSRGKRGGNVYFERIVSLKIMNRTIKTIAVVIFALLFIYFMVSLYFINHFYFNTYINDEIYSLKSLDTAKEEISQVVEYYELKVEGRNGLSDTITGKDIMIQYKSDEQIEQFLKSQNPLLWPISFIQSSNYVSDHLVTFDQSLLEKEIKNLVFNQSENIIMPKDATISEYNQEKSQFLIIEEVEGAYLNYDKMIQIIIKAIDGLLPVVSLEEEKAYYAPEIDRNSKSLQKTVALMNHYVGASVNYKLSNLNEVLDYNTIHNWIKNENGRVSLDEEQIREYVKQFAKKYNTYGKNREFKTTSGNTIKLPSGGYGWLIDQEAEYQALLSNIENGEVVSREPVYSVRGYTRAENDIGNTYVEADLGSQHLYFYQEGELILETDFVSGNMVKGFATPPGVFGITYKARNATLRGEDYETPVNYWIPFNGNIGLHDAVWRKSFGGDIYINHGSHGCLNLPKDKAEQLFSLTEQGMPVVCYY